MAPGQGPYPLADADQARPPPRVGLLLAQQREVLAQQQAAVRRPDRLMALVRANLALFARDPGPLAGRIIQPLLSLLILQRLYIAALGGPAQGTTQVVDIGASVCAGLGGGLVPLSDLPPWTHLIAPLSPAYWAVLALRGAIQGQEATTLTASAALAAIAAGSITIGGRRLARGWGRSTLL